MSKDNKQIIAAIALACLVSLTIFITVYLFTKIQIAQYELYFIRDEWTGLTNFNTND